MTPTKYGNKKTKVRVGDDIYEFDSKKEAKRFNELYLLLKAKRISELKVQPEFLLQDTQKHNGVTYSKVKYVADFSYIQNGKKIVEDVKGYKTSVYQVKVKWFLSLYGNKLTFKEIL